MSVQNPLTAPEARAARGTALPFGSESYNAVNDFLIAEAWILDDGRFQEWLALLSPDIRYFMPTRATVIRTDGDGFDDAMGHFDETYQSLELRVRRLTESVSAWTEAPPSRTRRLITNVQVWAGDGDRYHARSACLLLRNRLDNPTFDILACARLDQLQRVEDGFRLVDRRIEIDQSTLGTSNLSMFF